MKKEWVEAIKAGKPEIGLLELRLRRPADRGVPARQRRHPFAGKKLEWDAAKLKFTNSADGDEARQQGVPQGLGRPGHR